MIMLFGWNQKTKQKKRYREAYRFFQPQLPKLYDQLATANVGTGSKVLDQDELTYFALSATCVFIPTYEQDPKNGLKNFEVQDFCNWLLDGIAAEQKRPTDPLIHTFNARHTEYAHLFVETFTGPATPINAVPLVKAFDAHLGGTLGDLPVVASTILHNMLAHFERLVRRGV